MSAYYFSLPDGIAYDSMYNKIYWTDPDEQDLEMYNLDTKDRKIVFQNGPDSKPRAIVLDSDKRYVAKGPGISFVKTSFL